MSEDDVRRVEREKLSRKWARAYGQRTLRPNGTLSEVVLSPEDLVGMGWLHPIEGEHEMALLPRPNRVEAALLLRLISSDPDRLLVFTPDDEEDKTPDHRRLAHYLAFQLRCIAECIEDARWPRGRDGSLLEQQKLEHAARQAERRIQDAPKRKGLVKKILLEEAQRLASESSPPLTERDVLRISTQIYEAMRRRKRHLQILKSKSGE